jgi:hypothetical protein
MRSTWTLRGLALAVACFALASAQGVTVDKSQSAAILMQPYRCYTNYNGAVGVTSPALLGSPIGGMDMIQFDVSAYTNKLVDGDAQLL